jgi:hypothetical protein
VSRYVKLSFDERPIDRQFRHVWRELLCPPFFYLPPHWFEITLHSINANGEAVFERKILRVFREDGTIVPLKREVVTYEDAQADCAG